MVVVGGGEAVVVILIVRQGGWGSFCFVSCMISEQSAIEVLYTKPVELIRNTLDSKPPPPSPMMMRDFGFIRRIHTRGATYSRHLVITQKS